MRDKTLLQLVELTPKHEVSRVLGAISRTRFPPPLRGAVLRWFVNHYGVNLDEADRPLDGYATLHDLFTRALKPGVRTVDPDPARVVSPVDGAVSESGAIENGTLIQAKGRRYHVHSLLDDEGDARDFFGGEFLTIYLAPRDYHRIHTCVAGELIAYRHVPGTLYPVFPPAVREVDALFAVNERVISFFETPAGRVAEIKVAAFGVGGIRVNYADVQTNSRSASGGKVTLREPRRYAKGAELGMFCFGSTVILLFQAGRIRLDDLPPGTRVRMGQGIGTINV